MKKFLTVLLALSVVFTYTVGSAFAAVSTDEVNALKVYTTEQAQKYYGKTGKIAKVADSYLDKIVYDEDGYVFNVGELKGYVKAEVIKTFADKQVDEAEKLFSSRVAAFEYGEGEGNIADKAGVLTALERAYSEAVTEVTDKVIEEGQLTSAIVQELVKAQFAAEKQIALDVFAKVDVNAYSDSLKEYKIVGAAITELGDLGTVGKLGIENQKEYTAKGYVKAILNKQSAVVAAADPETNAKDAIDEVRNAAKIADQVIFGHKKENAADYYLAPIPTIKDLADDTTVDGAKDSALAQLKAAIASKQIEMANAIQTGITKLNEYSKLSDEQKALLEKLNEQKAELAANFAAYEEVVAAKTDYKTTVKSVNEYKTAVLEEIAELGNTTNGDYNTKAVNVFETVNGIVKTVKTLKADADLLALQLDVNGKPYYDAEVLKANLADAIEAAYNGTSYEDAYQMLAGGSEVALVKAKINYVNFIKGNATDGFNPKDSRGYVADLWNKVDAENEAATITVLGNYNDGVTKMYDTKQAEALASLVKETATSIEAATTIGEIEKIFAAANDKYVEIPTTDEHQASWNNGKLKAAYEVGKYQKELEAYAKYFIDKVDESKYPEALLASYSEVLSAVVYPVIYTAYTPEELPAKVAEAKAAIDGIMTNEAIKAQRDKVESTIKALPAVSAITVADKDAIVAAKDLLDAYGNIPGNINYPVRNSAVLNAAVKAYENAAVLEMKDAYNVLKNKDITVEDTKTIEDLRDKYDAFESFTNEYGNKVTPDSPSDADIKALETKLSDAKVADAKALMIKLPANPTAKDRAAVEAARAAYNALTLEEKEKIVGTLAYDNLIDAEEALDVLTKYAVRSLKITASSVAKKGSITVKWKVKGDASGVENFEIWKSTKKNKGFKKAFTTKTSDKRWYKNTAGLKKGTRYYYKVRAVAFDSKDNKITSDWSNKAYRLAK